MWTMLAAQGVSTLMNDKADKAQAKYQKRMQNYRNKMTNIANAINQNAITTSSTLQLQQSAQQAVYIKKDELSTTASSAVAAAAAGVRGNSVTQTLVSLQQKSAGLEKQRRDDLQQYFLQSDQQRLSSSLSAVQNQDLTHIPQPKLGQYLLKAGMEVAGSSQGQAAIGSLFSGGSSGGRTDSFSNGISRTHFSGTGNTITWR